MLPGMFNPLVGDGFTYEIAITPETYALGAATGFNAAAAAGSINPTSIAGFTIEILAQTSGSGFLTLAGDATSEFPNGLQFYVDGVFVGESLSGSYDSGSDQTTFSFGDPFGFSDGVPAAVGIIKL